MKKIPPQVQAGRPPGEAPDARPERLAAGRGDGPDGANLILAGPGSGKTRVITYRVAYLISQGVPASSVLLVTFTRRAAREMVGRLETLIGPSTRRGCGPAPSTTSGTACSGVRPSAAWLMGPNFSILDSEDQLDLAPSGNGRSPGLLGTRARWLRSRRRVHHLLSLCSANIGRPLDEHDPANASSRA